MYHDVSADPAALIDRDTMPADEFRKHVRAIGKVVAGGPDPATALTNGNSVHLLLTFDDGRTGTYDYAARILDEVGWRAHFFIITDLIGTTGFLTRRQIRALAEQGHVIGTHSCSHPLRISACSGHQLLHEWTASRKALEEIVGAPVLFGSIPNGDYSRAVAQAAAASGLKALFSSEPVTSTFEVEGCLVLGRFCLRRGTSPRIAAGLVQGQFCRRFGQLVAWNFRQIAKSIGATRLKRSWHD